MVNIYYQNFNVKLKNKYVPLETYAPKLTEKLKVV